MQLPGGVRLGAHALPAAVRAGDGDGGGARAARAARRPRAQGAAGAHHARAAPSTYLLHPGSWILDMHLLVLLVPFKFHSLN